MIRRILSIAIALCLLWAVAAADGSGYNGAPVDISTKGYIPYHWEVQHRNGTAIAWGIENLFDGRWSTIMEYIGWNDAALDEEPEVTLYFNNATIKDVWFRNATTSDSPTYKMYARMYRIEVTVWCGNETEPRGTWVFTKLPDVCDPSLLTQDMIDGYQRLSLPQIFENVTKVELWLKGWYPGEGERKTMYWMQIADMVFLPDSPGNLFGYQIYDGGYVWQPTAAPQITATPQPAVTQAPSTGIQVITKQRLATRSGPGTVYTETGSYFQSGTWVKAISSAYDQGNGIWWIQVELTYNGELRRVYTGVKRLVMAADQVPVETPLEEAVLSRSVYAYWGPGYGYAMYEKQVPAGTEGTIWAIEGSYAQFEYYDEEAQMLRRVWVPESALESGNG